MSCLCAILHAIKITCQYTTINVSLAQHKPYLKVLYNAYAIDNSVDNSNMVTLSMEPRSEPLLFTIITVSPVIQSALGILLDSRNAAISSKPNVLHVLLPFQNNRIFSKHVLCTHSPLIINASAGT